MNPFSQALEEGYSEDDILNFISNAYPSLNNKIQKAVKSGYKANDIFNFLNKLFGQKKQKNIPAEGMTQQSIHAIKTKEDEALQQQLLKAGLQLGAGVGVGKAIQTALPKIGNLLGRGNVAKPPGTPPPIPAASLPELRAALDNLKLTSKIERLATSNNPEVLGGMLQKQITPEQKQVLEGKFGKPFGELVKDYANFYLQKAEEKPLSRESLNKQFEEREVSREQIPEEKKEKLVALPNGGIGTLLGEKQGIADIQLPDGEIRRRKLTEVDVEPPELEKQITDLIQAIPEDERSAVLAFASYNPEVEIELGEKKFKVPMMAVQFHTGDFYMYPGITKDQFDRVVSKSVKAKTSGENPWHAFTAGDPSRGAGMNELVQLTKQMGNSVAKFKASEGYDYFKRIREIVKKIERERKTKKRP